MPLRTLLSATIILLLAGCGNATQNPPQKPTIQLDSTELDFNQQFGSGTYIGTQPQNSIQLLNTGLNDLTISSIDKAGDSAFSMQISPPLPATVKYQNRAFITVTFAPTQAKAYSGSLTIHSNADNQPVVTVKLSGLGVAAPDAGP